VSLWREDEVQSLTDVTDNSLEHREMVDDTLTTTSQAGGRSSTTLSRTVLALSHADLVSTSSQHDATCPPELPVLDDTDCGVSATDRLRIEMFYRSRETDVYVCSCLADLVVGPGGGAAGRWVHLHTGVPVWLLDSGRGRRRRQLVVALAERRTGLALWHDRITYLSNYAPDDDGGGGGGGAAAAHVLRPSSNLSGAVRIVMFNRRSAAAFLDRFHRFTADPVDDLWRISDDRGAGTDLGGRWPWNRRRRRRPCWSKESISQPCHVVLISRTDLRHANFRAAFAHLLPASPPPAGPQASPAAAAAVEPAAQAEAADQFRPRLPTR